MVENLEGELSWDPEDSGGTVVRKEQVEKVWTTVFTPHPPPFLGASKKVVGLRCTSHTMSNNIFEQC